jgi:hypothetical protein
MVVAFFIILGLFASLILSFSWLGWEKDDHGCNITTGYSWSESKQRCIRSFEEDRDDVLILDSSECGEFLDICSPGDKEKP